ncbi:MAG: signal peptidase II [Gemmatimonadaceae bacterium]|nr:signal peptidase II [Gemmatimonadaceae bacterium]
MPRSSSKALIFWPLISSLVVIDRLTKGIAERSLWPRGVPQAVFGDWFRWTLVYNPGAAFGLHLGPYSRWIFLALTAGALVILLRLYGMTAPADRWRVLAIGLVTSGAIGNLIDRIVSPRGVVDFIDIGIGDSRWPTFNVADMAVSTGAFLLAWVLWGEDRAEAARRSAVASNSTAET